MSTEEMIQENENVFPGNVRNIEERSSENDGNVLPGLDIPEPEEKTENGEENFSPEELASGTRKKILLAGIGGSGAKIVRAFTGLPYTACVKTAVIDTDREDVEMCGNSVKVQAEAEWTVKSGLGCGGDVVKGERAVERERQTLTRVFAGYDYIIVTGGLGGGTATGGVRTLASVARQLSIPVLFMLSTPFSFESYTRRRNADDAIRELLQVTDALITLPNDLLFSTLPPDAGVEESFQLAAESLAVSVFGVAELLASKKIIGGDFADFVALLRKKRSSCAVGIGVASGKDGLDRCGIALENMLDSPFLGGVSCLTQAHAVIMCITGGKNFTVAEMRQTLDRASSLVPGTADFTAGITVNPALEDKVLLSCFAVKYDSVPRVQEPVWGGSPLPAVSRNTGNETGKKDMEQGMLNLQSFSRGIFADAPVNKYKDEDLDIPTYQRRGISIDKGTVGK